MVFRCIEVRFSYWIFAGIAKRVGFGVCKACFKMLRFVLTGYTLKRRGSLNSCQTCFWSHLKTKDHTELFVLNEALYSSFRPLNKPLSLTYQSLGFDPTFMKKKRQQYFPKQQTADQIKCFLGISSLNIHEEEAACKLN